ncbi:MAG: hypothetical protein ACTS2F_04620 [Thainema sp.]
MSKVLRATYQDGNLVLDEKLDAALEGQKLTLILIENTDSSTQSEADLEKRKRQFLDKAKRYSAKLPTGYKFEREEAHER